MPQVQFGLQDITNNYEEAVIDLRKWIRGSDAFAALTFHQKTSLLSEANDALWNDRIEALERQVRATQPSH